jgi:DNA-3-methyladenine glycosylase
LSFGNRIDRDFFARPARLVAKSLLGKNLVRNSDAGLIKGKIVETEAYCDTDQLDLACHGDRSNRGRPTERTKVMFGPPGYAYVYFTYGMHWMFNIVTGAEGQANAVLLRALEPVEGLSIMTRYRNNMPLEQLSNGPAKLAQALAIDNSLNGTDLCLDNSVIWIEDNQPTEKMTICSGPRIGLGSTPEPWLSIPWRFWIRNNPFVSR